MQGSEQFKKVIQEHLDARADNDTIFSDLLKKEGKNIDGCVGYILSQVQKSGKCGFSDEEIFGLAAHYYDEEVVVEEEVFNGQIVVNQSVPMSDDDRALAKQAAMDRLVMEEYSKLKSRKQSRKKETTIDSATLFD